MKPLAPKTAKKYQELIARALGNLPLDGSGRLSPSVVSQWPTSQRKLLKSALKRRCLETGVGFDAYNKAVPDLYEVRKALDIPQEDEMRAVVAAFDALAPEKRALALLPLMLGLRANELLGASRQAIQTAARHGTLTLVRKGGQEQTLPAKHTKELFSSLLASLASLGLPRLNEKPLKPHAWDHVWEILSPSSQESAYQLYWRLIRDAGEKADVKGLRPHKLRHAFAIKMMRDGAPLSVIQWMLNHASPMTTMHYARATNLDAEKYLPKI